MTLVVLGVDPGAAHTGLVLREGPDLLAHTTVERNKLTPQSYLCHVLHHTLTLCDIASPELVGIEEVTAPLYYGGKKLIDPIHAISTALVAGAVAGWAWSGPVQVVWVPAGHNGQGVLEAYPAELRPTRGRGAGQDRMRHCRSAWDCAHLAGLYATARDVTVVTGGTLTVRKGPNEGS